MRLPWSARPLPLCNSIPRDMDSLVTLVFRSVFLCWCLVPFARRRASLITSRCLQSMKRCYPFPLWARVCALFFLLCLALPGFSQVIDPPVDPPPVNVVSIRVVDAEGAEPDRLPPSTGQPVAYNPLVFVISRLGPTDFELPVLYHLSGTAANGSDYAFLPGKILIPKGSASVRLSIVPLDDQLPEPTETVVVTLDYPICPAIVPPPRECYLLGQPSVAQGTLLDNNGGDPNNRPPKADIVSPARGAKFVAPATIDIVVQTADADGYVPWVEFFAGKEKIGNSRIEFVKAPEPGTLITHTFHWENVPEGSYALTALAHDSGGATTATSEVDIYVVSGGPRTVVSIRVTDAEGAEPNPVAPGMGMPIRLDPATFTISREGDLTSALVVYYHLEGSAQNGVDYDKLPGQIEIPAGEKSVQLMVMPIDDQQVEGSETVTVVIDPPICPAVAKPLPACYVVGTEAGAKAIILDNDPNASLRPVVSILARDALATEGPSDWATPTATFVVRRQGPLDEELTVGLKVGGTAIAGVDYESVGTQVVIPAGAASVRLVIRPIDDDVIERIETVSIQLLPAGAVLPRPGLGWPPYELGHPSRGVVVILDNDQARPPCRVLPDGKVHLCLPGERGQLYQLEISSDLTQWTSLGSVSAEDGAVHYVDPDAEGASSSHRFYRLEPLALDSPAANE